MKKGEFDFDAWITRNAKKIGVEPEKLKKAFLEQFEKEKDINAPLDVPDRWIATYRYSYAGQSRFFREILFNKKLCGSKCPDCGKVFCPPRTNCPHCYSKTEWVHLSGKGTVESYTTIFVGTSAAVRKFPFICAYVKLDGADTVICTNIEMDDIAKAHVGMRVEAVFKEDRDGTMTDFYFKPLEGEDV